MESIQKEDWERFRALGNVPPSIREVVLRSWVRSQDAAGVETLARAPVIAPDELFNVRSRNVRLRKAAQSAVRRAGYLLEDAGAMLLLCNRDGVVMEATGDARVLSRGEENHLRPGGRWEEGAIGTNAIGTALHVAKPVSISGVEHFCEAIQRWSCAAAPIHDPASGYLLGVIDISGPSDENFRQASALSVALALQIEEALHGFNLQEHKTLIDRLLRRRKVHGGDEAIVLDRYGHEVWSTAPMQTTVAGRAGGLPTFNELARECGGDAHHLAERMREILPEADVDLVSEQGDPIGLIITLAREHARRSRTGPPTNDTPAIVQPGSALNEVYDLARKLVANRVPLLIKGAAGSGKETLARALHADGPLASLPFEVVECGLLTPESLRSGLGRDGAFTEFAQTGGTLVLDEPAETPVAVQALLSQSLAQLFRNDGPPLQLVALSSTPLSELLAAGALRADLYFRLAGATVRLPALAERRGELTGLVRHFAERYAQRRQGKTLRFTPAAMLQLQAYDWPGNLRELRNLIETVSATSLSGLIDVPDLPPAIRGVGISREETLRDRERSEILNAVSATSGNMTETARRLGISRSTLYLKLAQYGVSRGRRH